MIHTVAFQKYVFKNIFYGVWNGRTLKERTLKERTLDERTLDERTLLMSEITLKNQLCISVHAKVVVVSFYEHFMWQMHF